MTLLELLVVVAIIAVLAALSVFALTGATRAARLSGMRFQLVTLISLARNSAMSRGSDVYVIFTNMNSRQAWPRSGASRVIVYVDPDFSMRGQETTNLMSVVNANPGNIREEVSAAGEVFGTTGLAFVPRAAGSVSACNLTTLPAYMAITRTTNQSTADAFCTFCMDQNSVRVGAIRFSADGRATIVTDSRTGRGGAFKLVDPDSSREECIAISEPNGMAVVL